MTLQGRHFKGQYLVPTTDQNSRVANPTASAFCREDLLLKLAAQIERARPEWFGAVPPVHVS